MLSTLAAATRPISFSRLDGTNSKGLNKEISQTEPKFFIIKKNNSKRAPGDYFRPALYIHLNRIYSNFLFKIRLCCIRQCPNIYQDHRRGCHKPSYCDRSRILTGTFRLPYETLDIESESCPMERNSKRLTYFTSCFVKKRVKIVSKQRTTREFVWALLGGEWAFSFRSYEFYSKCFLNGSTWFRRASVRTNSFV